MVRPKPGPKPGVPFRAPGLNGVFPRDGAPALNGVVVLDRGVAVGPREGPREAEMDGVP